MKRLLFFLLALAAPLAATQSLTAILSTSASSGLAPGFPLTVTLQVQNNGPSGLNSVTPTLQTYDDGMGASLQSGPLPSSLSLNSGLTGSFTWTFLPSNQCGEISFSGSASGTDGSAVLQTSNVAASIHVYTLCSYTVTSTITPTSSPSSTATPTPTPTAGSTTATPSPSPWIILATATAGPSQGDANIPGNLFHPNAGQPLQLKFYAPLDGGVSIDLYDRTGRLIHHVQRDVSAGSYTELWDGQTDNGDVAATGIYVAQFKGKGLFKTVKFAVIK